VVKTTGSHEEEAFMHLTVITGCTSQHYYEDSSRGSEAEPDMRCTSINATETVDMPSVKLWKSCDVAGFVVELLMSCTTGINYKHNSS
jgi:hypothetical protein